jgi:glycine/D-amino acid oxidase-like deaminating enzyme
MYQRLKLDADARNIKGVRGDAQRRNSGTMNPPIERQHRLLRRRELLAGLIGIGAAGVTGPLVAAARPLQVGVIGAGIVGASIAMHLAETGARVTVFEKAGPAEGATQNSFAWVNAFTDEAHYRALRIQSLLAYRDLDRSLSLNMVWGGYLNWASTASESQMVRANARQLAQTPYPVRRLTPQELAVLDPHLVPGPVTDAIFSSIDAHLDPVAVTRRFLERAIQAGARFVCPAEVTALDIRRSRCSGVTTPRGAYPLDRLVIAAGVDTPRLLAQANVRLPLKHAPGILAHTRPLPLMTRPVHDAPGDLTFKQMMDGSVVGTDALDPPDISAHRDIRDHPIDFPSDTLRAYHGNRILGKIGAFLPAVRDIALDRLTLGFRPVPLDEFPVMGALPTVPNIHVAVTHSGVTLAPIVGRYTADEVLRGSRVEMFAPYRPERF